MANGMISIKLITALLLVAFLTGCSKKENEIKALKQQLTEQQKNLDYWQGAYEAVSADYRDVKAMRRNLNTQLNTFADSTKSAEEQLNIYAQLIINLQLQIQDLNTVVSEQQQIIDQQEADLQEFMSMVGVTSEGQAANGQINDNQTTLEQSPTDY